MLFLQCRQEPQLFLQVGEQPLTGFQGAVGGGEKLLEEIARLIRRRLGYLSHGDDPFADVRRNAACAERGRSDAEGLGDSALVLNA